ncbi:hypothetical protein DFH28DRAFT_917290, partial [Melampsora americana]
MVRGPVSRSEASLRGAFGDDFMSNVGRCDQECETCHASRWAKERTKQYRNTNRQRYSNCCQSGKVLLPSFYFPQCNTPDIIKWMMTSPDPDAVAARRQIRDYNNVLSFTS